MSDSRAAVSELGAWAAALRWPDVPSPVQDRARLVMLDTLGVTMAGARTPELAALRKSWEPAPGPVRIIGGDGSAAPHDAMWLNGIASCCLEMDEGNKFVQGHPAAHVLFAVLAEAQSRPIAGADLLAAFLAGHEVASRFGRAMRRRPSLHTHGHWGALGAGAAVARLRGADGNTTAAVIDAAAGMVVAGPWDVALRGSFVRNTWIGIANVAGRAAAALSLAGLAGVDGTPDSTLGGLLGELDPEPLTEALGQRFDVSYGYFKRHSSCSYTHPPADAVLGLRADRALPPESVAAILVETNGLAAPLNSRELPTRLAAMFSIPYVVAVALVEGALLPESFDDTHRNDPELRRLMAKVEVRRTDAMDARLPAERAARVTITTTDGIALVREVPNPVGDADHLPFGRADVLDKLAGLLDAGTVVQLVRAVDALAHSDDGGALLGRST